MKIILADDHSLFRDGLCSMLGSEASCHQASCLDEMLTQLETHSDAELILMDLNMPGMAGFEGLKHVRGLYPHIPLIVVSMHNEPNMIRAALSHGASGYIPKTHSFELMQKAIDLVLSGSPYIPEEILASNNSAASPTARLTRRQKDVHTLLIQGESNQEIADKLYVSPSPPFTHKSRHRTLAHGSDQGAVRR